MQRRVRVMKNVFWNIQPGKRRVCLKEVNSDFWPDCVLLGPSGSFVNVMLKKDGPVWIFLDFDDVAFCEFLRVT